MRYLCSLLAHSLAGLTLAAAPFAFPTDAQERNPIVDTKFIEQGWDEDERRLFYNEAQGSPIMPLAWFLALEQTNSTELFRDNEHLAGFGLIPEPAHDRNPEGLPVGLTIDRGLMQDEQMLGMNCSACHVGRMSANGVSVQVDGAPANFNFWTFIGELDDAIAETMANDARFERFAKRVGGDPAGLKARLRMTLQKRQDWQARNTVPHYPGPGRVDALGVILNQVTAKMTGRPDNARLVDAPVSYPFLWGAPYLTHVQYNGVAPNLGAGALARNVGQVLGVFGEVSLISGILPPGYPSSVSLGPLGDLEGTLETLLPPKWNDLAELGMVSAIDPARAERGAAVYAKTCKGCHVLMDGDKPGPLASVKVTLIDVTEVGTDPTASVNFVKRTAVSGPLDGRKELFAVGEPICDEAFANDLLVHVAVGVLANEAASHARQVSKDILRGVGSEISKWLGFGKTAKPHVHEDGPVRKLGDFTRAEDGGYDEAKGILESIGRGDAESRITTDGCGKTEKTAQYRARPLNAVWASAPFLHNGSVPSLAAMLTPPEERPRQFYTGALAFDETSVGFETGPGPGRFFFDTAIPGNSNLGHPFGTKLDAESKRDLIEYLKSF